MVCAGPVRAGFTSGSTAAETAISGSSTIAAVRERSARRRSPNESRIAGPCPGENPMARASRR